MAIMDHWHEKKGIPGAICYPQNPAILKKLLPAWVKVVTSIKDLPSDYTCVVDEASQIAHARRTSSQGALDTDALSSLSEQKSQLILFITHHSRKFDLNDIQATDLIIWKCPTLADTIFERDELQIYVLRAWEFFQKLDGRSPPNSQFTYDQLKSTYVMNFRRMEFYTFQNRLPKWWSHELSTVFKLFEDTSSNHNKKRRC
jgi:hypothetical protein